MSNSYQGQSTFCGVCHKPHPSLTGQNCCMCHKTDTGEELLGGTIFDDLGLGLLRPSSHGRIHTDARSIKPYWTEIKLREQQKMVEATARRQEYENKVYNQPSFIGRLVKLYREIRTNKLFIKLGKDYRDDNSSSGSLI
jgi:hypothetical protein